MEVFRQKNVASYIVFPIVDADGDFVTGATGLDSEIDSWSDGAAPDGFADCTNEATEIGATGIYYLSLTNTELNADYVVIQIKTTSAGAKTQAILIQTIVGDVSLLATTTSGRLLDVSANGNAGIDWANIDAPTTTVGLSGTTVKTATDVETDTADIQTRIPAALTADGNIKADTLRVGGTLQTAGDLAALLTTIDDFLDTEIADILTDTSTTLDDYVDDLETRLSAAIATALAAHTLALGRVVVAAGSTTTAVVFSTVNGAAPSAVDDFYNGRVLIFTSGALTLQATSISDYTGATTTATVPALTGAPADTVTAIMV